MPKPLLSITALLLIILAALLACTGVTPTPETTVPTAPTGIAAATALPANTPTPEATATPTERPTAARAATPTSPPTPAPAPGGRLAPIQMQEPGALLSALSDAELTCIGDDPEQLNRALTGAGPLSREERGEFFECLEDETMARIFLAGYVRGPTPLSQETSDCVRAGFAVIDPRAVMTAGIEGDPGRAMAGSLATLWVTMACLNDEEWEATRLQVGVGPEEREGIQCLLAALGGPGQMATAMVAAREGEFAELASAGADCDLDMGPLPGQPPGTPPPATTPASTPGATPTTVPSTATPTQASTPANTLVITVAAIPAGIPDYDRDEWKHWTDADGDCQDARQEVLIEESLEPVTFETDRKCRVETGQWWAPHLGHHLENPSHIDVDHHVPLKNAHMSGGWSWDAERKQDYANYLEDPAHLVAISSRHNRSKGAGAPRNGRLRTTLCGAITPWIGRRSRRSGS